MENEYLNKDGLTHLLQGLKPHMGGLKPEEYAALAKQGSDATLSLTSIDAKIGDLSTIMDAINGQSLDEIIDNYTQDIAAAIDEITGTVNK